MGRTHFRHRLAIPAASAAEAAAALRRFLADPGRRRPVTARWPAIRPPASPSSLPDKARSTPGWDSALYETQPVFREALDRCAELLAPQLDRPLLSLLDPQAGPVLDQTGYTQPVMFALEYALAALWRSWGIEPAAVLGHSVASSRRPAWPACSRWRTASA